MTNQEIMNLAVRAERSELRVKELRRALETARGLVSQHHSMSIKQELGKVCKICGSNYGVDCLDAIRAALKEEVTG